MPYKRVKNKVFSKATGSWKLKQTCKSVGNAIKAMKLLRGLEHGTIKMKDIYK